MAVGDAHVFPGFLTPVLTQLSFQNHRLLFSHASAEMRATILEYRKLFPKRQMLDSSKLKKFAGDIFKFDENGLKFA